MRHLCGVLGLFFGAGKILSKYLQKELAQVAITGYYARLLPM